MRPSKALQTYREQIRSVVFAHRATNVSVFRSVARGEDTDASDLDLLIDPTPETSLMDIGAILITRVGYILNTFLFLSPSYRPPYFFWL
jgi:predicted nucleotidyltransferase